jgi:AraC-like DNA-binding protein
MRVEQYVWYKRFVVPGAVPGLLRPDAIVVSEASSGNYRHEGRKRSREHHAVVFQYSLSGCGMFESAGKQHALPPGTGFCCYVGDPRIAYHYPGSASEPWRFLYVTFQDEPGITRVLNDHFGFVYRIDPAESQIRRLLDYGNFPDATVELSAGAGHLFVNGVIGMLVDQVQAQTAYPNAGIRLVRRAIQIIDAHLHVPFNAAMLANELAVSQEHLSRICRAELGRTPYQCICQSKIHRACELLNRTNRSVSEIASDLGYEPGSHFARLFKRVMGVTPSTFRNSPSLPLRPF